MTTYPKVCQHALLSPYFSGKCGRGHLCGFLCRSIPVIFSCTKQLARFAIANWYFTILP